MWGITPLDQLYCRILFRESRYDGPATPLGFKQAIVYPGYVGGVDWGGVAVDRSRQIMIVNSNRVGNLDRLLPRKVANEMGIKPYSTTSVSAIEGAGAQAGTPYAADIRPFFSPLWVPFSAVHPFPWVGAEPSSRRWVTSIWTGRQTS